MAAAKKPKQVLRSYVHVTNDKGDTTVFAPGQELPAWAAKIATNPKLFADAASVEESTEQEQPAGGGSDPKPYSEQDEDALKALLKERELPQDGDKDALVARLEQADAEAAAAANQ